MSVEHRLWSGIAIQPLRAAAPFALAVDALGAKGPHILGGKSMGGRVASMVADELFAAANASLETHALA